LREYKKRREVPEEKRPPNPEILKLKNLLKPFKTEQQRRLIMDYIENYTNGTTFMVVEYWLNERHIPSLIIRKGIISALESFPLDNLPVENIPVIVSKEGNAENLPTKKSSSVRLKRDNIIKANEKQLEVIRKRAEERKNPNIKIKSDEEYEALAKKLKKEGKIT
jgi:hypothetical protein